MFSNYLILCSRVQASNITSVHIRSRCFKGESRLSLKLLYFGHIRIKNSLCRLVIRVPGCRTEMYCASCEVRTEFICYAEDSRPPLWPSGQSSWIQNGDVLSEFMATERRCIVFPVRYEMNFYMLCRRKVTASVV
jgi:hypothetical protein